MIEAVFEITVGLMVVFTIIGVLSWIDADRGTTKVKLLIVFTALIIIFVLTWPNKPIGYCEFVCPVEGEE